MTLQRIDDMGCNVALFENEPMNLNFMSDYFYSALPVFLDIKHSPNPTLPYETVYKIKNILSN
ncbi:MAG: hypothetical protein CMF48_01855 [Legionellales bacterium]|nr:hypothetical protein [Legionellales bacterium]|tara:strand:+ start:2625 stop:2813 length:189 start_codon:yes stop_codon:yes gene_type:complete